LALCSVTTISTNSLTCPLTKAVYAAPIVFTSSTFLKLFSSSISNFNLSHRYCNVQHSGPIYV